MAVALLLPLASGVLATPQQGSAEYGLMQGFPPAAAQRVGRERTMIAPFNRWAFQHIRELPLLYPALAEHLMSQ